LKNKKISEENPQNEARLFAVELFNKRNPQYKFLSFTRVEVKWEWPMPPALQPLDEKFIILFSWTSTLSQRPN
jgi:hypothetical protein